MVILEVLPRMGGQYWTPAFAPHAKAYNRHIQALIYHYKDPTPISFWFHAGLASNPNYFAADGVHLSDSGTSKYIVTQASHPQVSCSPAPLSDATYQVVLFLLLPLFSYSVCQGMM